MELNTVTDAFDRVVKKQKLSSSKSHEVIDQVGNEIEQALAKIMSPHDPSSPVDSRSILTELKLKLHAIAPLQQLEGCQKELNISLSKYPKQLDKFFNPDISRACRNVDFDFHVLNQIIANYFYQLGMFDLGDSLVKEAGEPGEPEAAMLKFQFLVKEAEPEAAMLKFQFLEMHQVLEAMKVRNLEPALNWVYTNREKLKKNGSTLELKLHSLQYMEILEKGNPPDAVNYAKTYLAPFAYLYKDEIMKLMGCLAFRGRLASSPYSELISPTRWENVTEELNEQFCSLLGQSSNSPLSVAMAAGFEGLPTLLKLANVMAAKKQEWQAMKQLPVPVELGKEFQYHSIFVCPVSRDQASEENPPLLMPCSHVLCKQSIIKLSKSGTRTFKCPYCPAEASVGQCRQLFF
ncbi:hypothetical protein UlMin_042710 [Ulmus minor]